MEKKHEATSTVVAQINQVNILMVENGEKRIAIKPICEALGIDIDSQRKKLQADEFLSSVTVLSTATGSDGKEYKMVTIPYMYVFGWLFSINPKNVRAEVRETVLRYKMECYKALFNHFTRQNEFLEEKQLLIEKRIDEVNQISKEFSDAKNRLKEAKDELNQVKSLTFEEWRAVRSQLSIEFTEEEGGEK